jgi:endonuclease YncB( thermonuclease family)
MRRFFRRSSGKHNPALLGALLAAAVIYNFFSPGGDKAGTEPDRSTAPAAVQSAAGSKQASEDFGRTISVLAQADRNIPDGDTISVITEKGEKLRVRFLGIDTPETKQLHGPESQKTLENMVKAANYKVELRYRKTDRYGRAVAFVYANGKNLNYEQIKNGSAWYYRQYRKDLTALDASAPAKFEQAEKEARAQRLGLWKDANPQEPWEWRKEHPRNN